jgi:antitoxin (DNA-binding transcriptional repressor) of toxin-antitoxin stability system
MHVPISKFRSRLTAYLRLASGGRRLVLTSNGRAVATVQGAMKTPEGVPFIEGVAWAREKPALPARLADLPRANKPVAELIAAERRWRPGR